MTDEKSEVARSVWFSDGTSLDTRTTDGKKVPLYATVHEETPIGWYCELLTQFPMAPEIKSCDVLRGFENEGVPGIVGGSPKGKRGRGGSRGPDSG